MVSSKALSVVETLQSKGYDGYLVGGCVRDLILGQYPKDFDVATNALPADIQQVFTGSRIIGRRFKIVHVTFGRGRSREVIEVVTYRASQSTGKKHRGGSDRVVRSNHTGRILRDNVYGKLEEDVLRRDFSVNALYYDPCKETVIDYVGGVADIKSKKLRIIGDADTRFAEDPVRMIRAIRFQAKLGLSAESQISRSIRKNNQLLKQIPTARLFDEVIKLFHHGAAVKSWKLLFETPFGELLFPEVAAQFKAKTGRRFKSMILDALKNTDDRINQNLPVISSYFIAVILWRTYCDNLQNAYSRGLSGQGLQWDVASLSFKSQFLTYSVPVNLRKTALDIWSLQRPLEERRRQDISNILINKKFRAAFDFLTLRAGVGEINNSIADWWHNIQIVDNDRKEEMIAKLPQTQRRKKKRDKNRTKSSQKLSLQTVR